MPNLKPILLIPASIVVAVVLVWLWNKPGNYYDCVLHEMRGQSDSVMKFAQYVCKDRFGIPTAEAE